MDRSPWWRRTWTFLAWPEWRQRRHLRRHYDRVPGWYCGHVGCEVCGPHENAAGALPGDASDLSREDERWCEDLARAALPDPDDLGDPCPTCGGLGWCIYPSIEDQRLVRVECSDCAGEGVIP